MSQDSKESKSKESKSKQSESQESESKESESNEIILLKENQSKCLIDDQNSCRMTKFTNLVIRWMTKTCPMLIKLMSLND